MGKLLLPILALATLVMCGKTNHTSHSQPSDELTQSITWLEKEADRIIHESKRTMADGTAAFPPQVGIGYEAFWLRDYAYTLEGSVDSYTDKELTDACRLFVNSLREDGAGVDCIKFDGTPIYKPGYGTMGDNPVADGSQFTVDVAWHTYQKTKNKELLQEIIDPLVKTMNTVPTNPETRLVHIRADVDWDRCPYGFTDVTAKQGDLLFCSLLYVQASRQLAGLLKESGRNREAKTWLKESRKIEKSIRKVLWDPEVGLFRAATIRCREHDIWGSAFAVFLGVTRSEQQKSISQYFKEHYSQIVKEGQIRHLPGGVYWEKARYSEGTVSQDTYQNGAFWGTPTGWFVFTLNLVNPELADQTIIDMVTSYKSRGVCEWIIGTTYYRPDYLASAALPLDGIREMLKSRK